MIAPHSLQERPVLKPGDIFLSKNPMALGIAINAVQTFWSTDNKSEYSHSGIILDSAGKTLESLWTVKNQNLWDAYKGEQILIARHKLMSQGRFDLGYSKIEKHIGQVYPLWRLPIMVFPPAGKYLSFGRVVCSELTCKMLNGAGFNIEWKGKNPDNVHDMVRRWADWEIFFKRKVV